MTLSSRLLRRRAFAPILFGLALPWPAGAQRRQYQFDQRFGRIGFTARHFGLMSSNASFSRFDAQVALDPDNPSQATIEAIVETTSIDMAWPGGVDLLRSPAFFDSASHPQARFVGQAEGVARPERFNINGALTLRGITRPLMMEARLVKRSRDTPEGAETAEFTASGTLDRTEYGMVEDRIIISDRIRLDVLVRLQLGPA